MQRDSEDQQFHPVEFMSRKTNGFEEKNSSYELEVFAIVNALKKWRVYLLGKLTVVTDCNSFEMTIKKDDLPPRVARWAKARGCIKPIVMLSDHRFHKVTFSGGTGQRQLDKSC